MSAEINTEQIGENPPALLVRADDVDVRRANQQLKQAIAQGARGIAMVFEGAHNAFGFGLPARPDTIERLFEGIALEGLHLRLDNHPHGSTLSNQFVEFLQQNYIHPQRTKITFGVDPTATLASCGKLKMSIAALKASLPQSLSAFFASGLPGIVLESDGRPYHNAGADEAQELGAMLCVADEHLTMVEAGRHPVAHALPHIGFATVLTGNLQGSVVKLRVLQSLWLRLQAARGIKNPLPAPIHVETSRRILSASNPALNYARNHCAALAAIAGGAVSLSLLPASTPRGLPNDVARQATLASGRALLQDNPALGRSISVPSREEQDLSEKAWQHYRTFLGAGGVMAALMDGSLARQLMEAHERRLAVGSEQEYGDPEQFLKSDYRSSGKNCAKNKGLEQLAEPDETKTAPGLVVADIYDVSPINLDLEGVEHCQPLTPIFSLEQFSRKVETGFRD